MFDVISAFTGKSVTADGFIGWGKKILEAERGFNSAAGFSPQDDRLPEFFKKEPLAPHQVTFQVTDEELDQVFNW